jgi:hypothetical protein
MGNSSIPKGLGGIERLDRYDLKVKSSNTGGPFGCAQGRLRSAGYNFSVRRANLFCMNTV